MVFKMVTLDLRRSIEDDFGIGPPESPPSSPTTTLCCSATFAVAATAASTLDGCCSATFAVAATAASTLDVARLYRRRRFHLPKTEHSDMEPANLTIFTLKELEVATDKFSQENMIGRGGCGKVYKGTLPNGYVVAVKRISHKYDRDLLQFQAEVKVGKMPDHRNVAPLLGFCAKPKLKEYCLVYPYMANLSIQRCVTEGSMKWRTRMKIAIGAARGIAHLHSLNIIHRDIKPANILLDERFNPLIGDFGHAIFSEDYASDMATSRNNNLPISSQKAMSSDSDMEFTLSNVAGTFGYFAPESIHGRYSKKVDVFSFGVTLLGLITGEHSGFKELENGDCVSLRKWVTMLLREGRWERLIQENMELEDYEETELELALKIVLLCVQADPTERPTMIQVVQFLQGNGVDERWQHQMDKILQTHENEVGQEWVFFLVNGQEWVSDDYSLPLPEILSGPR